MVDTKLTDLTELGEAVADTDVIYGVNVSSGASAKILASRIKTYTSNSPTLVTPTLGVATATSINKVALTAPASGATLTIADGKTLTASNTLTFTGTDSSSVAFGTGGTVLYSGGALGTPASGTLTNCTGLPVGGISATGTPGATTYLRGDGSWQTVSGGATPGGSDTQVQFNDGGSALGGDAGLTYNKTSNDLTITGGGLVVTGNISAAAWTTSGIRFRGVAGTLTDTSSSGTVAAAYTNAYGGNTIAASNSTTFTNYYTTFITQPTAGTNVTFTGRWALGLSGPLMIAAGTVTTNTTPALDIAQTWNNSGVAFTGVKINITNTNSSALSYPLDVQVGGVSVLSVRKDGLVSASSQLTADSAVFCGWNGYIGYSDTQLRRDSSNIFAQRNSTNAQAFRVYNTFTDASNYERGFTRWNSNVFEVGTEAAGTGSNRALSLISATGVTSIDTISLTANGGSSSPALGRGTSGMYFSGANGSIFITTNGTYFGAFTVSPAIFQIRQAGLIGFESSGAASTPDVYIRRRGAANLALGDVDAAAPVAQTISVQSVVAGTSNTAGANFTISGSRGTGTGAGGSIIFQTAPAGTTGTSQNALSSAWAIDSNLTLYPAASQGTTMTAGFINIPGGAGAPTGVPATTTGFPLYWDSTNNKLYVYDGGWLSTAALT